MDLEVAQLVAQGPRLGEHFDDVLERARAARRVRPREEGRESTLVAEPARHLDRVRADDLGARLVAAVGDYAGKGRQQRDPERRFVPSKGGARLLEQLQRRPVGPALAPASVLQSDRGAREHVRVAGRAPDLGGCGERLDRLRGPAC